MELLYSCILFAGFSVVYSWELNEANYLKRQVIPQPRIGRSYYDSKRQGLIPSPRVGRSSFTSSFSGDTLDPIDSQMRAAASIPSYGKRANNKYDLDEQLWSDINEELKRAAVLIPRVGRAAFVPRIGKKAAFVPRIGRSVENVD